MNRRTFTVSSAGALAMTTNGVAVAAPQPKSGERAVLSGWLTEARHGASHYYVLGSSPFVRDPAAGELADWPHHLTMVLPADLDAMRPGRVSLRGQLYRGHFRDESTGRAAGAVLVGATLA
ncbi:MAG TPA: hypothetical protein VHW60_16175 [Caulobacteraceae bacterium]|jgi:hypothetical protein|nr:hypothetical protein [Caulobacteraceae bacterium]